MNIVASVFLWIFPALLLAALATGLVVFLVVRSKEKRRREEFQRRQAQAAQYRAQQDELKKMKIDDL